jgi:hypothetical protein
MILCLLFRSIPGHLIRERTPIVSWDKNDVPDGLSDSEEESEEEEESSEEEMQVEVGSKRYYWLALKEFLESQLGDCKYFLHGKRTNHTESFHNICNIYCPKGSNISTKMYIMKKQFAALHWNWNKAMQSGGVEVEMSVPWKEELLAKYLARKKKNLPVVHPLNPAKKLRLADKEVVPPRVNCSTDRNPTIATPYRGNNNNGS